MRETKVVHAFIATCLYKKSLETSCNSKNQSKTQTRIRKEVAKKLRQGKCSQSCSSGEIQY